MKIIEGGIVAPVGFKAASGYCGIKKAAKDLCLVVSDVKCEFAGCFTQNIVKAAPVLWDMELAEKKTKVKGLVVTSGNANACTGEKGIDDNYRLAQTAADCLHVLPEEILVCSTGVIGVPLPIDKISHGISIVCKMLDNTAECDHGAAEAIMTTDTFAKTISLEVFLSGNSVRIGAMAKGSGMIHPNMATMLAFITTDAAISQDMLEKALKESVADTYNMISVDGDTSTNDTLLILANGMAGNTLIDSENDDYMIFKSALDYVNKKLAVDIVRDGEGATKIMEVNVSGAKSKPDARKIARSVVSSSLFKAALFGSDANWGRALCAMGYSGASFNPDNVSIRYKSLSENNLDNSDDSSDLSDDPSDLSDDHGDIYEEIILMDRSVPIIFDENKAQRILDGKEIFIDIILDEGDGSATAWGCDLTYEYVKINGEYRS